MRYSVWNQSTGLFDYFEGGREQDKLNAPKPGHIGPRNLGSTIDQAAWPLPAGARKIGSGAVAVGRVARSGGSSGMSGLGDIFDSPTKIAIFAAFMYVAWRLDKSRRAR
jgi:hypothetical protein